MELGIFIKSSALLFEQSKLTGSSLACLQTLLRTHGLSQQGIWVSFFDFFHLHVIPMTFYKDIMPYFDKFIQVYG